MDDVLTWLKSGDPAITWQVLQDIEDKDFTFVFKERRRMNKEGWAAEILSNQSEDGTFGGGLYTPKWISTTYSMLLLKRIGLLPNRNTALAVNKLLGDNFAKKGGISYSNNKTSGATCITGMILGISSYFVAQDDRLDSLVEYFMDQQLDDGGWNCQHPKNKVKHSSFNTTILALEGLLAYRETFDKNLNDIRQMQKAAHEFLLDHQLFKSHKSGEIAYKDVIKLAFPYRWKYNILTGLDYFQNISYAFDDRFLSAIDYLNSKKINNKWKSSKAFSSGKTWIKLEDGRKYSRWVTMKALRINKWWDKKSKGKL